MNVFEATQYIQNSPEFAQKSLEGKIQIKSALLDQMRKTDEFRGLSLEDRHKFKNDFMTDIVGLKPEDFTEDTTEDQTIRDMLTDVQNVRAGADSTLNGWDGFTEATRNYLTGKVGAGIVDIFTVGDTTDALFGDSRKEAESYRDYVLEQYDPKGLKDYKAGKVFGHITGFAADAAATGALYGSIGTAGLLTKPVAGVAQKLLQASLKKFRN